MAFDFNLKAVIVGDEHAGKTTLVHCLQTNSPILEQDIEKLKEVRLLDNQVPTVTTNKLSRIGFNAGKPVRASVSLWDTAGAGEYDRLRPLSYPRTDVFVLCCAADNTAALERVRTRWLPEMRHHVPYCSVLLLKTKSDLDPEPRAVDEGKKTEMRQAYEVDNYHEVSTYTGSGLDTTMEEIFEAYVIKNDPKNKKRKENRCSIS